MQVMIDIPEKQLIELANDIMENYPEYSFCLDCVGWKYEKGVFVFEDQEEEEEDGTPKRYTVTTLEIAAKGLPLFIQGVVSGKYHFCGVESLDNALDPCCYDSPSLDAVVQLTIFGDIIYG